MNDQTPDQGRMDYCGAAAGEFERAGVTAPRSGTATGGPLTAAGGAGGGTAGATGPVRLIAVSAAGGSATCRCHEPAETAADDGPPLDGCGDVDMAAERGTWVRRAPVRGLQMPPHECMPPSRGRSSPLFDGAPVADAEPGELWRCDCGRLWECYRRSVVPGEPGGQRQERWRPAGLWLQARHARLWGRLDWRLVYASAVGVVVVVAVVVGSMLQG